jgi:uncharacterized repeat protein (TIGR01451 family)
MSIARQIIWLFCLSIFGLPTLAAAQTNVMVLDSFIETHRVPSVGVSWKMVTLANDYVAPVVSCTYVLASSSNNEAHTRVRNVGPLSFEVRAQRFEDPASLSASDVHCLVVETGAHTLADGRKIEARTVQSTNVSGKNVGWSNTTTENVTTSLTSGFSAMAIFGQVMTFADSRASVFWTNNCSNRGAPPTLTNFCVGKHIGQLSGTRGTETLGYIVAQPGSGTVNGVSYVFALGGNSIRGVGNSPAYNYTVSGDFDTAVATQAAENGGDGGWAVLYGSDPLPNNAIQLAIEEETLVGDSSRSHTAEQVYYAAFDSNQSALFEASKSLAMAADNPTVYAVPGSDVVYTIDIQNTGDGPADLNSIFLVDSLPAEVEFFNGDMDGAGPASGPVLFEAGTSGLTFTAATDLRYSNLVARPSNVGECLYTPTSGYDANVKHVCFSPRGYARPETLYAGNTASLSFRVQIP